jgi:hypothetical protein
LLFINSNKSFTMIPQFKKWLLCATLVGAAALADSCKKVETTPPNTPPPVVTTTNNPGGPTFSSIDVYPPNSTFFVGSTISLSFTATAATGTGITKVWRNDGLTGTVDTLLFSDASGTKASAPIIDIYTAPISQGGKTVTITYTVYDSSITSHKAVSNKITRKLDIVGVPKQYKNNWTVTIGDQSYQQAFINTGGIAGNANPQIFTTGQVSGTPSLRNTVDIICGSSSHHSGVFLCAPSNPAINFDSISDFHMNTWTLAQRNGTLFKRVSSGSVDVTTFKTAADIKTKYNSITTSNTIVQSPFSQSDSYVFLTVDGRYGAFTVLQKGSNFVKFSLAVESR